MTLRPGTILLTLLLFSIPLAAQVADDSAPCSLSRAEGAGKQDVATLWRGIKSFPRNAIRPRNLAWELPVAAATGLLIAKGDQSAADRIQSRSLQDTSALWSNVGEGMEIAAGAGAWTVGCLSHRPQVSQAGFAALAAMGAAGLANVGVKFAFDRQYPYTNRSTGAFWSNGHSFASGHSATSFGFAATIAHRYPHKTWIKWGAYALATGVSVARYPAKKHYPSDILIGGTLGYLTGTYLSDHNR